MKMSQNENNTNKIIFDCDLKHNDPLFVDERDLHRFERMRDAAYESGDFSEESLKMMDDGVNNQRLFILKSHFCGNCKHIDKSLKWHQENDCEITMERVIESHGYLYTCNLYEAED